MPRGVSGSMPGGDTRDMPRGAPGGMPGGRQRAGREGGTGRGGGAAGDPRVRCRSPRYTRGCPQGQPRRGFPRGSCRGPDWRKAGHRRGCDTEGSRGRCTLGTPLAPPRGSRECTTGASPGAPAGAQTGAKPGTGGGCDTEGSRGGMPRAHGGSSRDQSLASDFRCMAVSGGTGGAGCTGEPPVNTAGEPPARGGGHHCHQKI